MVFDRLPQIRFRNEFFSGDPIGSPFGYERIRGHYRSVLEMR